MTEHKDAIVENAIQILEQAVESLKTNRRYNGKGIGYEDYVPNGLEDNVRCLLEPFKRVCVSGRTEQARDCVGYAALFTAWVLAGMPQSRFAPIMRRFYLDFYKNLKESDTGRTKSVV